jgi:sugar phosphate isomerase/epimerase
MPFTAVASIPQGAELVTAVGHPACGLVVDAWHVFRAGTTPAEVAACLTPDILFGVELDDADPAVVGTLFEDTVHRRRYCGEGTFDLPGLVRALRDTGFDGPWGVEILSDEHRARPLVEGLRMARDTALGVLTVQSGPAAR